MAPFMNKANQIPLDFWTLFCVYSACVCPDMKHSPFKNGNIQKAITIADKAFEAFMRRFADRRNNLLCHEDMPLLAYGISRTTFVAGDRVDSKNPVFRLMMWLTSNLRLRMDKSKVICFSDDRSSVKISKSIISFACAFASDIRELCPLNKLQSITSNEQNSLRLPNLPKTEVAFSEDLVQQVEELLSPQNAKLRESRSWVVSRVRLFAVAKIVKRLDELKLTDFVSKVF